MITLYSTIFMESYAHFKVMLTALSWGNLFGTEGASVFLVLLVFTLPEPHLIYVAAFSFCSNFQADFSKLSMDFMNFHHLTPSWHSEVGEPEQPEWVFWLGLHYRLKENWEISPDHKNLMLCWTEWKWFWWISVLNELSSFQLMLWVKEVHWILCSKVLCVCKKRMPKDQRTESKGNKKAKNLDSATVGTAMWPMKNCQRSGFGIELEGEKVVKQRAVSSCCAALTLLRETELLCSLQISITICITKAPDSEFLPFVLFPKTNLYLSRKQQHSNVNHHITRDYGIRKIILSHFHGNEWEWYCRGRLKSCSN